MFEEEFFDVMRKMAIKQSVIVVMDFFEGISKAKIDKHITQEKKQKSDFILSAMRDFFEIKKERKSRKTVKTGALKQIK